MKQRQKTPKTTTKTSKNSPIKNNNLSPANVAASEENNSTIKQITNFTEQISEKMLRLQPKHQKVNESLRAIRSQGVRLLGPGSKISQNSKAKLIALYQTAQKQCVSEHSTIMQLLDNIQTVRQLRLKQRMADKLSRGSLMILLAQHAATLPLYVGYIEGHPPPLVGAIPRLNGEPINVGHFVAAFSEDIWILGEVKAHLPTDYGLEYSIRDIDDEVEEEGGMVAGTSSTTNNTTLTTNNEKLLTVDSNKVIALPHYRADPRRHAHALFPKGAIVLALYPQTTCFYKGIVETPPSGPNDDYLIAFEDSTFSTGYSPTLPVPQFYVLTFRDVSSSTICAYFNKNKRKTLSPETKETSSTSST
ncbi:unnamed protein product [Meloidogyne enterolobii]|uniref:Uncharacterized protein n=1 Tax=Meloidogyne enterolobii TaxID=390850 RepID=A0ACB0YVI1_MELEN